MSLADYWERRYQEYPGVFAGEPNWFLRSVIDQLPAAGRVLCVGDGEGRNSRFLAERGFAVTAVDFSPTAIHRAACDTPQVCHVVADLVSWVKTDQAQGPWDIIVWIWVVTSNDDEVSRRLADTVVANGQVCYVGAPALVSPRELYDRWPGFEWELATTHDDCVGLARRRAACGAG
ncbi:MAG: class I SAM-dependent methyltransferase [Propionibacteriaceae bacterium]